MIYVSNVKYVISKVDFISSFFVNNEILCLWGKLESR